MKNYELYWKEIHIGSLAETNWDMRSYGDILYHFDFSSENSLLAASIRSSIKASTYLEEGDNDNYLKICEEEDQYFDIINSSDWYLINNKGETIKILCPIFHNNNEITWQEDF